LGLIVCEQIIIEERTRNVTLVNCFSRLLVDRFPARPRPFVVYAGLIDGFGELTLDLVLHRLDTYLDTYEEVLRRGQRLRFSDRLQEIRFVFRITQFAFPAAGQYQVSLLAEGELIAQNRIQIMLREAQL
jgi:hypothetical protein